MYNVTIKHRQFEGGEEYWTVPVRPYLERGSEDWLGIIFFAEEPTEENHTPEIIDWVFLPREGFGYVRAIKRKDA